jgi:hypothetical protein
VIDAEEMCQRLMRTAHLGEYLALDGGAGEPAKFGNELAHGAGPPEVAVAGHVRGEITLQS